MAQERGADAEVHDAEDERKSVGEAAPEKILPDARVPREADARLVADGPRREDGRDEVPEESRAEEEEEPLFAVSRPGECDRVHRDEHHDSSEYLVEGVARHAKLHLEDAREREHHEVCAVRERGDEHAPAHRRFVRGHEERRGGGDERDSEDEEDPEREDRGKDPLRFRLRFPCDARDADGEEPEVRGDGEEPGELVDRGVLPVPGASEIPGDRAEDENLQSGDHELRPDLGEGVRGDLPCVFHTTPRVRELWAQG